METSARSSSKRWHLVVKAEPRKGTEVQNTRTSNFLETSNEDLTPCGRQKVCHGDADRHNSEKINYLEIPYGGFYSTLPWSTHSQKAYNEPRPERLLFFFFGFKDVKSAVLPRACTSLRQHLPALNFLWLEEKHVPDGNAEVT